MARDKKGKAGSLHRKVQGNTSCQSFYNPFAVLDQHFRCLPAGRPGCVKQERPGMLVRPSVGDRDLLADAMTGVKPFRQGGAMRIPPPSPCRVPPRFREREDREAVEFLGGFVRGEGPFELSYTEEYIDGAVASLPTEMLTKLRRGQFSWQDHLDLHGCTKRQARSLAIEFVIESFSRGRRCVLIVCGRGLNSEGREPVLKRHLVLWLTHAPLKRLVLAFASARTWDGGAGAFYVLLGSKPAKSPFLISA
jgi:DNA-nicking Smr family endonuclease